MADKHGKRCSTSLVIAAAAAKVLQSCPTLLDPIDGSPPGSTVPGILQARTLEWVAISFSNAWKWKVKVKSLSHVWLLATPWTAAYQAPLSMRFSRQEYWSGVPSPSPSLAIKEMQIQTTVRYHFTSTRMVILFFWKKEKLQVGKYVEKSEPWYIAIGDIKLYRCYRKQFGNITKFKHTITIWSSNSIPKCTPQRTKKRHSDPCVSMFIAALFIQPKGGNNPGVHQWVNRDTKCGTPIQWDIIKP